MAWGAGVFALGKRAGQIFLERSKEQGIFWMSDDQNGVFSQIRTAYCVFEVRQTVFVTPKEPDKKLANAYFWHSHIEMDCTRYKVKGSSFSLHNY